MKKYYQLPLIITLLLALCNTCKKDNDGEPLPPYTDVGANTFTFRVNGKVYETEVGYIPIAPKIRVFYNHIDAILHYDYHFAITGRKVLLEHNKTISINIRYMPKIGKYILSSEDNYADYMDYKPNQLDYITDNEHLSELLITKLDTVNHIISGKFSIKAKRWCLNKECTEVILIDGQFDVKYKPNIGVSYY